MGTLVIVGFLLVAFLGLRLYRVVQRRREKAAAVLPAIQFKLASDSEFTRMMRRVTIVIAVVGCLVAAGLLVFQIFPVQNTVGMGAFVLAVCAIWFWGYGRGGGTAELDDEQLVVRTRHGLRFYRWENVADVRVATWLEMDAIERIINRLLGMDMSERFGSLRLRRSDRMGLGLWKPEYGTDVVGVPTLMKTVRLFVEDPDGFVQAARSHLARHQPV